MRILSIIFSLSLLIIGCGEDAKKKKEHEDAKNDPEIPLAIPCVACGDKVSKTTNECRQCGHPTPDSVVAYKKANVLAKIEAEKAIKLQNIRAEQARLKRKQHKEELEKKAQHISQELGMDDYKVILSAIEFTDIDYMPYGYTGWAKDLDDQYFGGISGLYELKDKTIKFGVRYHKSGKLKSWNDRDGYFGDGTETEWYENGKKKLELSFEDNKKTGHRIWWHENGQKASEANLKDQEMDGVVTSWYENGQKKTESNYLKGKLLSAISWKPNGEKCSISEITNGKGVIVIYNNEGQESHREKYHEGKPLTD